MLEFHYNLSTIEQIIYKKQNFLYSLRVYIMIFQIIFKKYNFWHNIK